MAAKIKIKNLNEGYQSIITNGKHTIIGDEPIASKGTDLGLSPTELVLSGLAMCKVATVRFIARKNGWTIWDVNAYLEQEVKRQPNGMNTNVKIKLSIDGDLSGDQINELIKQADNCYVNRMLNGEWNIEQAEYIQEEVVLNN